MKRFLSQFAVGIATLFATVDLAEAQRREPPGRRSPPEAAPQPGPDIDSFLRCYRAERFPEFVCGVLIARPGRSIERYEAIYAQQFESMFQNIFRHPDVRMRGAGDLKRLLGAEFDGLVAGNNWVLAADQVARKSGAQRLFLIVLVPNGARDDRGRVMYNGSYEVWDADTNRPIASVAFPRPFAGAGPRDAGRQPRGMAGTVNGIARRMIDDYVNFQCGGAVAPPVAPNANPAYVPGSDPVVIDPPSFRPGSANPQPANPVRPAAPAGPAREFEVRFYGDFARRDTSRIVREIRGFPSLRDVIGDPMVDGNTVTMKVRASGDAFGVGEELIYAVFMATGKEATVDLADRRRVDLRVIDPAVARWIGEEHEFNGTFRHRLRTAYREQGQPLIGVLSREVVGQDRNNQGVLVRTGWYWYHLFNRKVWEDVGSPRDYGGEAFMSDLARHLGNVGLRASDAAQVFRVAANPNERENPESAVIEEILMRRGITILADGRGEVSRAPQETQVSFNYRVNRIDNFEILGATTTPARHIDNGGLVGGPWIEEMGEELAAQVIEQMYRRWTQGTDVLQLALVDARTVGEADAIRDGIQNDVLGVDYTAFRALGDAGQIIEIGHKAPRAVDEIRSGLESGRWGLQFRLLEGSTPGLLRLALD